MNAIRLLLVLMIIPASVIFAANHQRLNKSFVYKHFDSKNGLSSNQTSHIFQDTKGYLWISHWKGLSRFDGNNFVNFRDVDGLFASSSFDMIEFVPDHFLVQHTKGISLFTPQKQTYKVAFPDTINGLRIGQGLYHNNQFWIFNCYSSTSKKICHLKYDENWITEPEAFGDIILSILQPKPNQNAYLLSEKSVYQLNNGSFSKVKTLKHKYASFAIDQDNICWGFSKSDRRFYMIAIEGSIFTEIPTNLFAQNLIDQERPDCFIVLPDNEGIVYFNSKYELFLATKSGNKQLGHSFSLIRQMLIDKEKNLWIATEEGIFNFYRLDFERVKLTFSDKSDMFWSIAQFGKNRIVAGRFGFGFVELLDSVWIQVPMNYSKDIRSGMEPNAAYMGAISTNQQEAWFPVWHGLVKFDKSGQWKTFPLPTTPEHLYIDSKSQDTIFAATSGGMLTIGPNDKIDWIGKSAGFSGFQNESIVKDKFNRFWLGSSQGPVQVYDGKRVLSANETPEMSNVISSVKDSKENLWFGTDKGLFYYDYSSTKQIKAETMNESIDLLVNYNDSILVALGFKKLILINYKNIPFGIKIYNEYELGVMQNTYMIDNQGYLWFSTMYDLIRFNPLKLINHSSNHILQPFVSSVEYSADNVHWKKHKQLIIPEIKNNNLKFSYIALVYKNQEQLQYRTFLENFDTWSQPTANREVYYTNLEPGQYRLGVQCSVDGQNWSPVSYSDFVEIKAIWYQIIWVRIVLLGLLILSLLALSYKINNNLNKAKIRKLTEQKNLNQLQLQLVRSKQIPHFSGNALANIEHYIFTADLKQANKYLSKLSRLLNQTDQDADKPARPLIKELDLVQLYLELEIMRFGDDSIAYEILIDETVDKEILIPNMLLHTWVENAVRHGLRHKKGKGLIVIAASQKNNILHLLVEDNGIGRDNANKMGTAGSGKGLQILKSQFEIYNQFNELKIQMDIVDLLTEDGEAAGTRFSIDIPANYSFSL